MAVPVWDVDLREVLDGMDRRRRRSRQRDPGASDLGLCRRRVAYKLARQPIDHHGDKRKAIQGTLLHRGVLAACKNAHGGITEVKVARPGVIRGSADWVRYDPLGLPIVDDVKTTGKDNHESVIRGPITRPHLWQIMVYADLLRAGDIAPTEKRLPPEPLEVVDIEILWLCRDDGRAAARRVPFQQDVADEAYDWMREVRERTETDGPKFVPRDLPGPEASEICRQCPFVGDCWKWDPERARRKPLELGPSDLEEWVRKYHEAAKAESVAAAAKKLARAHLDGQPAMAWPSGWELQWTGGKPKVVEEPDIDAVLADWTAAGLAVPLREVDRTKAPSIRVLPPPPAGAR